jgi:hypothetical protein
VPADPDASRARDTGALVESPPRETETTTSRLDDFFEEPEVDTTPAKRPARSRERREITPKAEQPPRRPPRMQARKVHRLVRHIEPWSVLKVSLIFFFCIWVILLTSAIILWQVASSSGVIDNVESFIEEIFALDSFSFEAGQMFRAYAVGGLVMVVAATGFTVLLAVLFNLISDLTGGVRVTVVEEETARYVEPESPTTGSATALSSPAPGASTSSTVGLDTAPHAALPPR